MYSFWCKIKLCPIIKLFYAQMFAKSLCAKMLSLCKDRCIEMATVYPLIEYLLNATTFRCPSIASNSCITDFRVVQENSLLKSIFYWLKSTSIGVQAASQTISHQLLSFQLMICTYGRPYTGTLYCCWHRIDVCFRVSSHFIVAGILFIMF